MIPPCIQMVYDRNLTRLDFNLPGDRFLFLCAYDVLSTQARKNPLGAIKAFKRAFTKNDPSVGLVLKINNARENPGEIKQLHDELQGYSNCYFIEDGLERLKFNALINLVDAYISLHRSEGFGLIPAEAMSLGKPVIMTRWSGNLDLMTTDNSCGVDYKLIQVEEKTGPYLTGQIWAEPDIDHAAFFMKKLRSDRQYYSHISKHAIKFIRDHFSPEVIGQQIEDRMGKIGLL
jgi:glycosyltransferase involved in cell wall biosynthesis